jgi:hypothetical protein
MPTWAGGDMIISNLDDEFDRDIETLRPNIQHAEELKALGQERSRRT